MANDGKVDLQDVEEKTQYSDLTQLTNYYQPTLPHQQILYREKKKKKGLSLVAIIIFSLIIISLLQSWQNPDSISSEEYATELDTAEEGNSWVVSGTINTSVFQPSVKSYYFYSFEGNNSAYFYSYENVGSEGDDIIVEIEYKNDQPWLHKNLSSNICCGLIIEIAILSLVVFQYFVQQLPLK